MRIRTIVSSLGTLVATAATAMVCTGCPGTLDNPERFISDAGDALAPPLPTVDAAPATPNCDTAIPTMFTTDCATAGCHAGATASNGLDLTLAASDIRTKLRNKAAVGDPTVLLIDPTHPDKSALYTKTGDPPPFGGPMPPTFELDAPTRACLLTWIQEP